MTWHVPEGSSTQQGFCACYNGYRGKFCEVDQAAISKCAGHGTPLCPANSGKGAQVVSLNDGSLLSGQYFCDNAGLTRSNTVRGQTGCQCSVGYTPEITLAGDNRLKCATPVSCAVSGQKVGAKASDGLCKCFADYYDLADATTGADGACLPGCRANRCSGHGTCIADPDSTDTYNTGCDCDDGWRTSSNQQRQNRQFTAFASKTFCDIPYDANYQPRNKNCGYWANEAAGPIGQNCVLNLNYQTQFSQLQINTFTGLYVHFCPLSSIAALKNQVCSGPKNGACLPDKYSGTYCQCLNGFTNTPVGSGAIKGDCSQRTCPLEYYKNGVACNGVGGCDNPTLTSGTFDPEQGRCICNDGFYGSACEKITSDCFASQPANSYPTNHGFPSIYTS